MIAIVRPIPLISISAGQGAVGSCWRAPPPEPCARAIPARHRGRSPPGLPLAPSTDPHLNEPSFEPERRRGRPIVPAPWMAGQCKYLAGLNLKKRVDCGGRDGIAWGPEWGEVGR